MTTKMYNAEIKFEGQEDTVIIGVEGESADDVYNFLPCILPKDVACEVIDIVLDENVTVEQERERQEQRQKSNEELQEKYKEIENEFVQICNNLTEHQMDVGMGIALDKATNEFFISELDKLDTLDPIQFQIVLRAEKSENEDIAEDVTENIEEGE